MRSIGVRASPAEACVNKLARIQLSGVLLETPLEIMLDRPVRKGIWSQRVLPVTEGDARVRHLRAGDQ